MKMSKRLYVGLFGKDQVMLSDIRHLLALADHTVATGKEQESLEAFLEVTIRRLKQRNGPLYDLLIICASVAELVADKRVFEHLTQLIELDRFPVILLTDAENSEFERLKASLPRVHLLSCEPLYQQDFFQAIATTTGVAVPHSLLFLRGIERMQYEQLSRMQQTERAWIRRRRAWLDQRQEWLDQRKEWLDQRREWIMERRQQPDCQREWLDEQQVWVQQQYQEVGQQRKWIDHLRLWLERYQRRLDQPEEQPPLSEAQ